VYEAYGQQVQIQAAFVFIAPHGEEVTIAVAAHKGLFVLFAFNKEIWRLTILFLAAGRAFSGKDSNF
jgi:hypothetical protein